MTFGLNDNHAKLHRGKFPHLRLASRASMPLKLVCRLLIPWVNDSRLLLCSLDISRILSMVGSFLHGMSIRRRTKSNATSTLTSRVARLGSDTWCLAPRTRHTVRCRHSAACAFDTPRKPETSISDVQDRHWLQTLLTVLILLIRILLGSNSCPCELQCPGVLGEEREPGSCVLSGLLDLSEYPKLSVACGIF